MPANQNSIYALIAGYPYEGPLDDQVLNILYEHNLMPYFFSSDRAFPVELQKMRRTILMKQQLEYQMMCKDLVEVVEALEAEGVQYRVLKGLAIAQAYPVPYARIMGDFDICVQKENLDHAIKALESLRYRKSEKDSTDSDMAYFKEGHLKIELHRQLFDDGRVARGDELIHELWIDASEIKVGDKLILVPQIEMHFKYLIIHMYKHLTYAGFGIRNLLDLVHFCNLHAIDCSAYETYFEDCGYDVFYKAVISICVFELGMSQEDKSWLFDEEEYIVKDVMTYILLSGAFGNGNDEAIIRRLYSKHLKPDHRKQSIQLVVTALFPSTKGIGHYYNYARKMPILLPVAWVHRWLRFVVRPDWSLKTKLFVLTKDQESFVLKDRMMKALGFYEE